MAAKPYLSFKQFLQRQQALTLYRDFLRAIRGIGDELQRAETRAWVRGEFEKWKHTADEDVVRTLLSQGRTALREMKTNIEMAK